MAATEHAQGGINAHPMEQFTIRPLFGDEVGLFTITNSTLWMFIAILAATALLVLPTRNGALVPTRMQLVAEGIYGFVRKMVDDTLGPEGRPFFPYIFTLFVFILMSNVLGLLPWSFTTTSHIAVTGVLALAVFISVTAIGFARHGLHFISLFWVSSAPTVALRCVLFVIEFISYFVRPLSHSVRLAGNMMAGHAVLKVFAAFVPAMGIAGIIPIGAMTGIYALELLVACVQAYIFTILTCVYLNDALHMH
ncbi:F-type H+-transporting ATPase subunit a [Oceanicella actignis]|uniref:ATP synthase subunit a n=2 Tax=Oceanicella actignis TaxID=1189325 RepID=A0A1M7TES7_9RHOB|nr:ATP synthase F0 subcomplex A subunit [Oceanicella actignis]SET61693.1 ATP synthase F0 subcomplex A subunit [Oceanicella actignis]SHN69274.1 F-type H+-transporting ATPase subunit a [Oceanicella actignis]